MGVVYTQLSIKDRVQIERWRLATVPVRDLARVLQRSKATIHRKIERNWCNVECLPAYDGYYGAAARHNDTSRRWRQHQKRLDARADRQQIDPWRSAAPGLQGNNLPRQLLEGRRGAGALVIPAQHQKARWPRHGRKCRASKFDHDVNILFRPDVAHRREFDHREGD